MQNLSDNNPVEKLRFESQNPINWKRDKCVICKFPMKLEPTNHTTPDNEMTFGDFIIRYEHKFLTKFLDYWTNWTIWSHQKFRKLLWIIERLHYDLQWFNHSVK